MGLFISKSWAALVLSLAGMAAAQGTLAQTETGSDQIKRGEYLATAGDCLACHSRPGGAAFAGGRSIQTPFGTIASPNITPDKETGIGDWSDEDFYKALHDGIRKGGDYLYPVFPFDHYTKVTKDDVLAIKAYLFSLKPVHQPNEANGLSFPYNIRSTMGVWRTLYFKPGDFKPDPSKSPEINRGAYLVEGLAHCGACHTTRNLLGASINGDELRGASVQGWYAPNITSGPDGVGSWSNEELASFLKTGASPKHGVVAGPMAETVHDSLMKLTDADIQAIAAYLKSTPPKTDVAIGGSQDFGMIRTGANIYVSNCASCHQLNGQGVSGKIPPLAENGSVTGGGPQNVIQAVLGGLIANANYGPMPSFAAVLSDRDVAAVSNYVRTQWRNNAPENSDPMLVARTRQEMRIALVSGQSGNTCEAFSEARARGVADRLPESVKKALANLNYDLIAPEIPAVVQEAKASLPDVSVSDLTNGLAAALCSNVEQRPGLSALSKRNMLDLFAQLAYTQLTGGNLLPRAKGVQSKASIVH